MLIIDGDVLVYMSIWGNETQEAAKQKFDELFTNIQETCFTEDYVMALGGDSNFRNDLYSDYKGNRAKSKSDRPEWFLDLKSQIVEEYEGCVFSDNMEADDLVRIWATQLKDYIIVTVDKDLDCIAGMHYNPRKNEFYEISDDYANKHYWKQILMGDMTDNIPGLPGIGPVKAVKILDSSDNYKASVCKAYYDQYGDKGYEYLLSNGKLIHILRHDTDYFKITKEAYEQAIT